MNREPNKEIDILLRKLSGKQNGNIGAAEGNSSASAHEHLDADELNAYAENALPASLRSHYTEHLADCNSCRKLVTQLSFSSTAIAQAPVEESAPSRLKAFLAGLFSPLVIRYAVPAMAVILVVAIAWIVVRREPAYEQVAQNTDSRAMPASEQTSPGTVAPVPTVSDSILKAEPAPVEKQATSQATPSEDRTAATSAGNKAPEASKEGEVAAKRDEPPPAAPVTVLAPSAGATAVAQPKAGSDVERNEPEAKKKAEADVAKVQNQNQNQIQNQQERRIYDQRSGPSEPKAAQRGARTQRSNEAERGLSRQRAKITEEKDKDAARDDEAEIRTVGGHKFTKRGRIWVDALYNSDSATTNVSRGSEQYRSLMGDEPGLRAIVEQLSGEILVVWKGRSYRIK